MNAAGSMFYRVVGVGWGGGGWIWTIKRFLLVDHHCSGMRSILAVDSLLIQIIIISGNLNKCINGLYASWDHQFQTLLVLLPWKDLPLQYSVVFTAMHASHRRKDNILFYSSVR